MRIPLNIPLSTDGKIATYTLTITAVYPSKPPAKLNSPCPLKQYEIGPAFIENTTNAQIAFEFNLAPADPTEAKSTTTPTVLVDLSFTKLGKITTERPQSLLDAAGNPTQFRLQAAETKTVTLSLFHSNGREISITVYQAAGVRQQLWQSVVRIVPEIVSIEKWMQNFATQLKNMEENFSKIPNLTPTDRVLAQNCMDVLKGQYNLLDRTFFVPKPPSTSALFQSVTSKESSGADTATKKVEVAMNVTEKSNITTPSCGSAS